MSKRGLHFNVVLNTVGIALMLEGLFMLTALPFSFYYRSGDHPAILISSGITLLAGFLAWILTKRSDQTNMGKREGYLIVTLTWILMSAFGLLPFMLSGSISGFTDAFFETISGFSTTGASVLTSVEDIPKGILFWRSMTHWIGGMGIIVLSVAILPYLGSSGMQLFAAETSGPMKDKLHPRIRETAKRLWAVYVLLTAAETIMLLFGGMSLFDALCHSFGTLATGGFSTRNLSMAAYSPYNQYVVLVFMFLAAINYTSHYFALRGNFSGYFRNQEFRFFTLIVIVCGLFISLWLLFANHYETEDAFRSGFFQVVSIISCTGFANDDFILWPTHLWVILLLLMFIGGCAGSTTGSIKSIRHLLLLKTGAREFRRIIHPSAVISIKHNGNPVSEDVLLKILLFFFVYLLTFATGTLLLCVNGVDLVSASSGVASCMGGVGPAMGVYGPMSNYSAAPEFSKWVLSSCMLLGRLELYAVFILFAPSFWKNK